MTILEAFFLGLIQGLTEFLPISSSGHLELFQYWLGFESLKDYILFNLVCHLGTLGAIFYQFFPEIKQSFTKHKETLLQLFLGTLPLFPLVFFIKPIKALFDQPKYLGFCFLITALLLFIGSRLANRFYNPQKRRFDSLTIGCFQACAILPGISRSGATISIARILGWEKEEAIRFSFLLAIPAIGGGLVIESAQLLTHPSSELVQIHIIHYSIGLVTSFIVGCLSLQWLRRLILQNKWHYFAWYCLFLGVGTLWYFNFFV